VHEKRRDFACQYCKGVAFGRASDLRRHVSAIHVKTKTKRAPSVLSPSTTLNLSPSPTTVAGDTTPPLAPAAHDIQLLLQFRWSQIMTPGQRPIRVQL